jgi:hypothetical protein
LVALFVLPHTSGKVIGVVIWFEFTTCSNSYIAAI